MNGRCPPGDGIANFPDSWWVWSLVSMERTDEVDVIDRKVSQLFALVSEALAQATHALLNGDLDMGRRVVAGDQIVDDLTAEVEMLVWRQIDRPGRGPELRQLIGILLILPELERSADLAEHVAQRAVDNLGVDMSPLEPGHRAADDRGGPRDVAHGSRCLR